MVQSVTPSPAHDQLLRAPTAAEALGVSRLTIWRYARDGKLTAVKLSARVTGFKRSQVQALIAGSSL